VAYIRPKIWVAHISFLRCGNPRTSTRRLFFRNSAYYFEPFVHTIYEKGSPMERNLQQQKQGAARSLEIFTFPIPDPASPSTDHQPLFTDHWPLIPVSDRCSL
jgi:hypothetical protein